LKVNKESRRFSTSEFGSDIEQNEQKESREKRNGDYPHRALRVDFGCVECLADSDYSGNAEKNMVEQAYKNRTRHFGRKPIPSYASERKDENKLCGKINCDYFQEETKRCHRKNCNTKKRGSRTRHIHE